MAGMARTGTYTGTTTSKVPSTLVGSGRSTIKVPVTAGSIPAPVAVPRAAPAAAPITTQGMTVQNVNPQGSDIDQIRNNYPNWMADPSQIQSAAKSLMPMYQARLGGIQGSSMDAMRLNAQQDIQSQYGNALRSATQQAGAQGIRGPAAVAMQQDIRNQMGQAQAKYSRDLTVADWDAQRQALADYYGLYQQQAGLGIGTMSGLAQLLIAQQAGQQQDSILRG